MFDMSLERLCLVLLFAAPSIFSQGPVSSSGGTTIVVWRVGSPHAGDTPDTTVPLDLKLSAKKLGVTVRIEAFPAKGFAQTFFDAFEAHQEPDVISIDNYGIIDGITTKLGAFTGMEAARPSPGAW
jgi:hypothetical protein